jgi:hypothetical protein
MADDSKITSGTTKQKDLGRAKLLYCGFVSGLVQAGLFNPWDRALYLSVANNRPFLNTMNFVSPWNGVFQTIFQRGISAGLYFPLEEIFSQYLTEAFKDKSSVQPWLVLCAGFLAGAGNGLIMNPISSIKYHYWGVSEIGTKENFASVAIDMLKRGGIRPFFVGVTATISRDVMFGGAFAYFRHDLPTRFASFPSSSSRKDNESFVLDVGKKSFVTDLVAGLIATTISSPLNYVRNIHYTVPPDVAADTTFKVLSNLWKDAAAEKSMILRLSHLQSRLRLGWGTARVGCGMALASQFYSFIKSQM